MNWILIALASPLAGFVISGVLGKKLPKNLVGMIATLAVLISFIASLMLFVQLKQNPAPVEARLFDFIRMGNFEINFGFLADRLTAVMLLVITGIGTLIHLYSIAYMHDDKGFYKFFAYLNLFVFNMLVLVLGNSFLMLFFGWEGVGLCSYLLIGFWFKNAAYGFAARKAFIMNRIGDLGLLLAIFLIWYNFKSLDYKTVFEQIIAHPDKTQMMNTISILLFVGAMGKSAQIPLYTWLPDAMAGPTPVSALIHAATMVTAGIYLVVRCEAMYNMAPIARNLVLIIGMATSICAALIGLKQNDIKKVLAYSTVSQLGLLFVALGCMAYTAAMFHLVTHAFFKALLFLGSGSVIHAMNGEQDIRKMGSLKKALPITHLTFLIGTLAICGFPLFSGFFSKDEILAEAYKQNPILWVLAVGSAAITAVYMLRLYWVTFHGEFRGTEEQKHHLHESPWLMTVPLLILAVLSLVGGVINLPPIISESMSHGLGHWLDAGLVEVAPVQHVDLPHSTEILLAGLTFLVFIAAFLFTRNKYIGKKQVPEVDEEQAGLGKVLANKFYVDEAYNATFSKPIASSGHLLTMLDEKVLSKVYTGFGKLSRKVGQVHKLLQNGNVEYYLLYITLGVVLMLVFTALRK